MKTAMVDSWKDFAELLDEQPNEFSSVQAARAALRSLPVLFADRVYDEQVSLQSSRIVLAAAVATSGVAFQLKQKYLISPSLNANRGRARVPAAHWAAHEAAEAAATGAFSSEPSLRCQDASSHSAYAAALSSKNDNALAMAYAKVWSSAIADLDAGGTAITIWATSLWQRGNGFEAVKVNTLDQLAKTDSRWSFWARWYDGFLTGKPLDWELQRQIALIPDEDWEAGSERIAEIIAELEARHEVVRAKDAVKAELRTASVDRLGIGGNHPPEAIEDDQEVDRRFALISKRLSDLERELEAKQPDKDRVESTLSFFIELRNWCGRKMDLAANTFIAGIILRFLSPEKVDALIAALRAWLPFI